MGKASSPRKCSDGAGKGAGDWLSREEVGSPACVMEGNTDLSCFKVSCLITTPCQCSLPGSPGLSDSCACVCACMCLRVRVCMHRCTGNCPSVLQEEKMLQEQRCPKPQFQAYSKSRNSERSGSQLLWCFLGRPRELSLVLWPSPPSSLLYKRNLYLS